MYGFTLIEFVGFLSQLTLVISAAVLLWMLIFSLMNLRIPKADEVGEGDYAYEHLIGILFKLFSFVFPATIILGFLRFAIAATAHEGVTLYFAPGEVAESFHFKIPLYFIAGLFAIFAFFTNRFYPRSFLKLLPIFSAFQFFIIFLIISLPAWAGEWGTRQWFYSLHGLHSIFTLGTVVVVDYLFYWSLKDEGVRRVFYKHLDMISNVIWGGLAIDLFSVLLIFPGALVLTPKFYFAQTVVAIIIINGALLSGTLSKKLRNLSKKRGYPAVLTGRWAAIAGFSGSLSIVSWTTITFIDSFEKLSLGYLTYFVIYVAIVLFAFFASRVLEGSTVDKV